MKSERIVSILAMYNHPDGDGGSTNEKPENGSGPGTGGDN
jgi:hypothetical protein